MHINPTNSGETPFLQLILEVRIHCDALQEIPHYKSHPKDVLLRN